MRRIIAVALVVVTALSVGVMASPDGAAILTRTTEVMRTDTRVMELAMVLVNNRGQERSRTVRVWAKSSNDGDKLMLLFEEPGDVAGTGFLVLGDDMWLYLPALKQTRRIAGNAKSGSFMGTDLSYEDMEALISTGYAGYDATWLADETLNGEATHKLRLVPTQGSSYDYLEMWVSAATFLPRRIDYLHKGDVAKTLTTKAFRQVEGRWTATELEMANHQTKTKTLLKVNSISFSEDVGDDLFTVRNLERGGAR